MKRRKQRRGFTLLEIFVAMSILTILVSVAMVGYVGYRDRVAMMVDETNQKILQASVKLFAYDNNALPATLSDLRPRDLNRAYALVMEGKRPYTLLAHLQLMWHKVVGVDVAEAFVSGDYYNRELAIITCLSDRTGDPPTPTGFDAAGRPTGGTSYGLALGVGGQPLAWLLNPANVNVVLIIETDTSQNPVEVFRHRGGTVAIRTTVGARSIHHTN